MKMILKVAVGILALGLFTMTSTLAYAVDIDKETKAFADYFVNKFKKKDVSFDSFNNGIYAIDEKSHEQWVEIEDFPPYEVIVDKGRELWSKKFSNGKSYASCFKGDLGKIRAQYPYHDEKLDSVITLELAINNCRKKNGEKPFKYKKGNIAYLSSYLAFEGRGEKLAVKVDTEKAKKWYEKGKTFFYAKRGQLNMSCADCHVYNVGKNIRADKLGPALGHTTGFPVMRSKWMSKGEGIGTLHRRYVGCNKNIRAKPFKAQSEEYRALEYFESVMSNGLELNGPSSRK